MAPELRFNPFEASRELKDQRALFEDCFPENRGNPTTLDPHYFWKFHCFPAKPPSFEYGCRSEDGLIGYYAAIPYQYQVGRQRRTAGMVCDVMTGSRARGKGVFTRLGGYSLEQMKSSSVDFTTGYPIRPEVLPGHLKVGWKVVQKMPIYIKVLKTRSLLNLKKLGVLSPVGDLAVSALNFLPGLLSAREESPVEQLSVAEFLGDESYIPFLERWLQSVPNALVKDRDFLRWRLGAPETNYRIFAARDSRGAMVAVCVTRNTVLNGIPALALLDLMTLPGHERTFRAIDRQLGLHALESGAEVIATMIHPSWAWQYGLHLLAYLRSPFVFSLIVRKLNEAIPDEAIFEPHRWHTTWLDSDDL